MITHKGAEWAKGRPLQKFLSFSEALKSTGLIRRLYDFEWCMGTSANIEIDGRYLPFMSRLRFGSGPSPRPRKAITYEKAELWEGIFEAEPVISALEGNMSTPIPVGKAALGAATANWCYRPPYTFWPRKIGTERCHLFAADVEAVTETDICEELPLARAGGPSFHSFYSAANYWMELGGHAGARDPRHWRLEVVLPLEKGAIKTVEATPATVEVFLDGSPEGAKSELHIAWDEAGRQRWRTEQVGGSQVTFKRPQAEAFSVYLVTNGRLRDTYRYHLNMDTPDMDLEQDILRLVDEGESEVCEFLQIPGNNPDEWPQSFWGEVLKVIIAFANTQGGHLLLGINDSGEATGWYSVLEKAGGGDADRGRFNIEKKFRDFFASRLAYLPSLFYTWTEISRKDVLDIQVIRTGLVGVTCDVDNNIFVRRGATVMRPSPLEINMMSGLADL